MNKHVTIICGFSGIGKSTADQRSKDVVDVESSGWSHVFPSGEKNPEFPKNYIDHLCKMIEEWPSKTFLLSCHEEVRRELRSRGMEYIIVMPYEDCENEYKKRWLRRGSSIEFINMMSEKWRDMIKSCESDSATKIYLRNYEYIGDFLCV